MERQLRVSVYRSGRIVDERFVPPKGLLAAATGLAPGTGRGSEEAPFFEHRDGEARVHVPAGLRGQVALDGRTPRPVGAGDLVLGPDARGWLELGDARVFFQVARALEKPPRQVLPRQARGGLRTAVELGFVAVLLAVGVVEGAALWRLHLRPMPLDLDAIGEEAPGPDGRIVRLPPPVVKPDLPRSAAPKPAKPVKAEGKPDKPGGGKAATDRDVVGRQPLITVLGTSDVMQRLLKPDYVLVDFPAIKAPVVAVADPRFVPKVGVIRDVLIQTALPPVDLVGTPGPGPGLKEKHLPRPPPIFTDECADGSCFEKEVPKSVAGAVTAEVRRRMGAVQECYEKALKLDHGLHGKVIPSFALLPTGHLAEVEVEDAGLGAPGVNACIVQRASSWTFGVHPAAPLPVQFPFVFSSGS
jgi:hypothetical protein